MLIHVEIQGDRDQNFTERMFRYFYRVFDKYNRKIYALAFLTYAGKSFKPHYYNYEFFGTKLTYTYHTYKILDQDEENLLASNNPFALVILAGLYVIKGKQRAEQKYSFKKPEKENWLFIKDVKPLIEKEGGRMGLSLENTSFAKYFRQQGREEGREEERSEIIRKLLSKGFTVEEVANTLEISLEETRRLGKQ